ncbi:unnamed protein product, partial [Caretta caretta]
WVDAFPLRTKSAYEVAKKIYSIIIKYGYVQRILTDGDPEFNNESLQKLVDDTGSNWDEFLGDILFSL